MVIGDADVTRPRTETEIRAAVNLIKRVMKEVMKDGVHYGTIPGTPKPTLYKAGSEKILSTFRIACEPHVEDLSSRDAFRYRVTARGIAQSDGTFLGAGVGEASTDEVKYKWRAAVCPQEFEETPEERRRKVWKKGRNNEAYQVSQVRTDPADLANTALKMAKKRAQIDMTLTVTGASDCFTQDVEDLPDEYIEKPINPPASEAQPGPVSDAAQPAANPAPQAAAPEHPGAAAPATSGGVGPVCACGLPAQFKSYTGRDGNLVRGWACPKPRAQQCAFWHRVAA
jgi:hypothetical protein